MRTILDAVGNAARLVRLASPSLPLALIPHTAIQVLLKDQLGFNEALGYGTGTVLLFHGPSGTGKTMTANALAAHLGKKLLMASFTSANGRASPELLQVIFREAKLQNAVVFFDECEGFFESRDINRNFSNNALLAEIERYDDLLILATNRPFDLDHALFRRITLSVAFHLPDAQLRLRIWQSHMPAALLKPDGQAPCVSLEDLARDFELSGGAIKNAILLGLSFALARAEQPQASASTRDCKKNGAQLAPACVESRGSCLGSSSGSGSSDNSAESKGSGEDRNAVAPGSEAAVWLRGLQLTQADLLRACRTQITNQLQLLGFHIDTPLCGSDGSAQELGGKHPIKT